MKRLFLRVVNVNVTQNQKVEVAAELMLVFLDHHHHFNVKIPCDTRKSDGGGIKIPVLGFK